MNPYLAPLVDEQNQLALGVNCFDGATKEIFKLKARVIMGVFDNPGSSKVLKSAGPGSLSNACRHCQIKGTNIQLHMPSSFLCVPFVRLKLIIESHLFVILCNKLRGTWQDTILSL